MTDVSPTARAITEIFQSIQGESTRAGFPCAFIRLTGCSLRCVWCDTAYAFHGGGEMPSRRRSSASWRSGTDLVEVTGGEPLEQEGVYPLMERLLDAGKTVLLETGGHVPLDRVDPRVVKIVDVKAPGSGMQHANLPENLDRLAAPRRAEVRAGRPPRLRLGARAGRRRRGPRPSGTRVTFSPVWGSLAGRRTWPPGSATAAGRSASASAPQDPLGRRARAR